MNSPCVDESTLVPSSLRADDVTHQGQIQPGERRLTAKEEGRRGGSEQLDADSSVSRVSSANTATEKKPRTATKRRGSRRK